MINVILTCAEVREVKLNLTKELIVAAYPTRGPIGANVHQRILEGQHRINEGAAAARELGCCSCEGDCAIVSTFAIIGGVAAGIPTGGAAAVPGAAGGALIGVAIVAVKKSIEQGRCVIL